MAIRRIIVATDGSDNSLRAAAYAGRLLATHLDAQVTITYVAGLPPEFQAAAAGEYLPELDVPLDVLIRRNAGPILSRTEEALGLPAERVQAEVLVGRAAEEIVLLADSLECDLIVCGRRGLSGWQEVFLGSVSNRLIHTSPCPVLVVQ